MKLKGRSHTEPTGSQLSDQFARGRRESDFQSQMCILHRLALAYLSDPLYDLGDPQTPGSGSLHY